MKSELLTPDETPFNLAGEKLDNSPSAEGEARARAEAEAIARKAQSTFNYDEGERPDDDDDRDYDESEHDGGRDWDCTGTWDGINVGTDADCGL